VKEVGSIIIKVVSHPHRTGQLSHDFSASIEDLT